MMRTKKRRGMAGGIVCLLLLLTAWLPTTATQASRVVTIDDIMKIRNILETQISPDGSEILYVISEPNLEESFYNTDIWMVSAAGGTPVKLTNGPKRDDTPRWSPDGRKVAFISDRDGTPQIWIINPHGGEAHKLTAVKSAVTDLAWSPDGKVIAYLAPDPLTEEEEKRKKERNDTKLVDQDLKMSHIYLIDVETKESRKLTRGAFHVQSISWSPDGRHIVFAAQPTPKASDIYRTDISTVSVEDGQLEKLVEREGMDASPQWSPDGTKIAFISTDGKIDWVGNTYLCTVSAQGGSIQNLSRSFDERIMSYHWSSDSRILYFSAIQKVTVQLFALSTDTGVVTPVTSGNRVYGGFSFTQDTRTMAFLATDPRTPREVYVSAVTDFHPMRLTTTNPHLEELELGHTEIIRWQSTDGMEIEGLLITPVGYEEGKRYPLLTYVHGGPSGVFMLAFAPQLGAAPLPIQAEPYPLQVFAGRGVALFLPNPRGSGGYGEKFRRANIKDWGDGDYNDIMSGIDALIQRGLADPEKLGIMGWSYGGYMTAWAITQTTRFKAASVGAGVTNLYSMYGQTDIPDAFESYFGAVPWEDREEYERHSPMFFAGHIKTPTLIQHGQADERVPLAQARELYRALKKNQVPVEFAIYPRQGHLILEPKLQADMLRRNLDWFMRWIQ